MFYQKTQLTGGFFLFLILNKRRNSRRIGTIFSGARLAVKVQSKFRLMDKVARNCGEASMFKHVRSEKRVLEALSNLAADRRCPFIMEYFGAFQTHQKVCLVTEYIGGGDMYSLVAKVGPFNLQWVRFYLAELAAALMFLHSHQVLYRDVKPENICLTGKDNIAFSFE